MLAKRCFKAMLQRVGVVIVLASFLAGAPVSAIAQQTAGVSIEPPESGQFPTISFLMKAYDNDGKFLANLIPDQVRVLENDQPVEVQFLERQQPGLQIIVAMNTAPIFASTVAGVSHFAQIKLTLLAWMQSNPPGENDDFSLATNTGLEAIRLTRAEQWQEALRQYDPPLLQTQASMVSLAQALDLATEPNPHPDMQRAILYITATPATPLQAALPNIASRANQLEVPIFVWMVAPLAHTNTPAAQSLRDLAEATGGEFFLFSGAEALPNPETYFESLRYHYRVSYHSSIDTSGSHRIAAEVRHENQRLVSNQRLFSLIILPPKPIFLAPPSRIDRVWSEGANRREPSRLEPTNIMIQMLVEYPDGYPRPLRKSRLYVNGVLTEEISAEPFDRFLWDLQGYTTSGTHYLQIEIEDKLGLTQSTIQTPVEIRVEAKRNPVAAFFGDYPLMIVVAVVAATAALVGTVIVARRALRLGDKRRKRKQALDPLRQPVEIRQEPPWQPRPNLGAAQAPTLPRPKEESDAPAQFVRLSESGHPMPGSSVPINRNEITFGSDPRQAIVVLDSPAVDTLHARLYQTPKGEYILVDAGSVAGTWVNYAPVSSQGVHLEHGDLIHIGRIAYRFELRSARDTRRPTVTPFQED